MKINENLNLDYILVLNVSDCNELYYYEGYYDFNKSNYSNNTTEYSNALKIYYKEEAEKLCNKINSQNMPFKYHVEEHCYM